MVGAALKKYAKAHALTCADGYAYGQLQGYAICMDDGPDQKRLWISTHFPDSEQKSSFESMLNNADLFTSYRVKNMSVQDKFIFFLFADKVGTMGIIEAFIDWLLPQLPQYGATGADICSECGCAMGGQGKWVSIDGAVYRMHESCLRSVTEKIRATDSAVKEEAGGSYLTGLIGALIGGLLGAAVWGFILNSGWMASIIGMLIGFLAEKGYTLLKGKQGKGKLAILIAVVILSVAAGTLFGLYLLLTNEAKTLDLSVSEYFSLLWKRVPEFRSAVLEDLLKNGLLGLLFAGLGVFGILRRTHTEVSGTKIKVLR